MISNILIIDDNKIDAFICKKIIEKHNPNIQTRIFGSGESALNYLKICQVKTKSKTIVFPDLILLDINMPQMDGFQFIQELKNESISPKGSSQIYMLTSSMYIEDIHRADNEPFCSGYIDKPLTGEKFTNLLKQYKRTA